MVNKFRYVNNVNFCKKNQKNNQVFKMYILIIYMSIFSVQSLNTSTLVYRKADNDNPPYDEAYSSNSIFDSWCYPANFGENPFDFNMYNDVEAEAIVSTPPPTITAAEKKSSTSIPSLTDYSKNAGLRTVTLENGLVVNATNYTKFEGMQKEMLDVLKYMDQAAREMGLTLTLSEIGRTPEVSDAAHAESPELKAKGGHSPHNYGAAVDIWLFCDGKCVVNTSTIQKKFADRVIELSNGTVTWGGYYKRDCNGPAQGTGEEHHFEITNWRDKYKNEDNLITKLSY